MFGEGVNTNGEAGLLPLVATETWVGFSKSPQILENFGKGVEVIKLPFPTGFVCTPFPFGCPITSIKRKNLLFCVVVLILITKIEH